MAPATSLRLVGEVELDKLRARPTWIDRVRPPGAHTFLTHHARSLNYFVTGAAWPSGSRRRPLGGMLSGFASVRCPTLEHGSFGVVAPHQVRWVLDALAEVDLAAVRARIERADPAALAEEAAEDHERLLEAGGDPAGVLTAELLALALLYQRAARRGCAIVSCAA
jgi:hypothetical protein